MAQVRAVWRWCACSTRRKARERRTQTITIMKFNELLLRRNELIHQARLANVAYAYQWLGDFAERIERAGLQGSVTLRGPDSESGRKEAQLTANDFSQAIVEEHFLEEEIAELNAVLTFVHGAESIAELKFSLDDIATRYLPSLRLVLETAEVLPREETSSVDEPGSESAS